MASHRQSLKGLTRILPGLFLLVLGAFPSASRLLTAPQTPAPTLAEIRAQARTVVDLSAEELGRAYPEELRDLEPAEKQTELGFILQKAGEAVDLFFRDFPNTAAKEQVRMERLRDDGGVEEHTDQSFNYMLEVSRENNEFNVEEFRTDSKGRPLRREPMGGFSYLTSGYATSCFFFHPRFQPISRFRYLGRQGSESKAYVVAFAQKPETGVSLGNFRIEGMPPEPLFYQGLAWVTPDAFQIVRMRTDLLAPKTYIGLTRQTSQIWFGEVRFSSVSHSFWLPREVVITAETLGRKFRNRHRYSEYEVFVVESRDKLEMPRIKKAPCS